MSKIVILKEYKDLKYKKSIEEFNYLKNTYYQLENDLFIKKILGKKIKKKMEQLYESVFV